MRIINPSYGVSPTAEAASSTVDQPPIDWLSDPIVMFSNSKPNCRELLDGVKAEMASFRSIDNIGFAFKDGAGQPAPETVIEEVAQSYRGAILAIAD